MCEPASFVVTKKQVFWSKNSDSHEDIIQEFDLKEMDVRNNPTFIRVEIVPPERDYRLPFSKWNYKLDQDIKPEWYDEKEVESRCRACLKDWRKSNVVMPEETINSLKDYKAAVYGTIKSVYAGTIGYVYAGTIEYVSGGTIGYVDGGTIESVHAGTIKSVYAGTIGYVDGGTIESVHGGTIESVYAGTIKSVYAGTIEYVYAGTIESVHGGTIEYVDGGTIKSVYAGTIEYVRGGMIEYVSGGTIKSVEGGTIKYVNGKLPTQITGNATIISYGSLSKDILASSKAVLIDRSGCVVVCHVGVDK